MSSATTSGRVRRFVLVGAAFLLAWGVGAACYAYVLGAVLARQRERS